MGDIVKTYHEFYKILQDAYLTAKVEKLSALFD